MYLAPCLRHSAQIPPAGTSDTLGTLYEIEKGALAFLVVDVWLIAYSKYFIAIATQCIAGDIDDNTDKCQVRRTVA